MWRGIKTDAATVDRAERGQKGGSGALAIGAEHLDDRERRAFQIKRPQRPPHAVEAEVHMEHAQRVQMAPDVLKITEEHRALRWGRLLPVLPDARARSPETDQAPARPAAPGAPQAACREACGRRRDWRDPWQSPCPA